MYWTCFFLIVAVALVYYLVVKPKMAMQYYVKQNIPSAFFAPMLGIFYHLIRGQYGKHKDALYPLKHLPSHIVDSKAKAFVTNIGAKPMVYLLDAKLIGEFMQKQVDCYEKSKSFTELSCHLLGNGIVFAEGDEWKEKRKLLSNVFHYNLIEEQVKLVSNVCDRVFDQSDEKAFCFLRICEKIGGDVGLMSFLGADVNKYKILGQEPYAGINSFIANFMEYMKNPLTLKFGLFFQKKQLRASDREMYRQSMEIKQFLRDIINDSIKQHKEAAAAAAIETGTKDATTSKKGIANIVNIMLEKGGLKTQEEIDEFGSITINFYFAAKDTISRLLANMFYFIGKHAHIYTELEKEIMSMSETEITMESLKKYTFLEAVIKESLRFCGPSPFLVQRTSTVEHQIGDIRIQKGVDVNCNLLHNFFNEEYFENAFDFNPHRWLDSTQSEKIRLNPFAYLPFSGGSRNCIGQYFAMMEMKVITIKFIRQYQKYEIPENFKYEIVLKSTIETNEHLTCALTRRVPKQSETS